MVATFCTSVKAQNQDEENGMIGHVTLANGTKILSSYNQLTGILSVEVENNDDEVEVIVVEDDTIINSESTISEEDKLQVALPENAHSIDVYVRTKEETRYVGSVKKSK